jgi:3-hydroxyisobutyrate dehydrogenase-like beta-hydroxyacid dehydrogenase
MSDSLPPFRDVAVLGLGLMGRASAVRLQQVGFNVVAWNRTRRDDLPCELSFAPDLERACSPPIIILLLSDSTAVDEILSNIEPFLRHSQIVVDMGSSKPWRSERHAARLAARGIGWVDAPVSGGPEGAEQGELAIMVGGDATHVARAKPIFDALGSNVTHVGGPGAGHTTKIVNQTMVGVLIEAVAEGLALAERAGLDPILVGEAVRGGSADSRPLRAQGPRMIARDYAPRAHVTTMLKDLRMAAGLGDRLGVELPCVERVIELAELLVQQGHGELDISALHRLRTD